MANKKNYPLFLLLDLLTDNTVHFTEASILEALMPVSNIFSVGQKLHIPDQILFDITKSPIEEQKPKLVAALFRVRPKTLVKRSIVP